LEQALDDLSLPENLVAEIGVPVQLM
jgi:hypothetical protein